MPTQDVQLTEANRLFVEAQIGTGRFIDASEVLCAGLRLLELQLQEEQEKLSLLKSLATEGFNQLDQGRGVVVDGPDALHDFLEEIGRRVEAKASNDCVGE